MIKGDNPIKYGTSAHLNRTKNWAFLNCTQTWYTCIALLNLTQTDHCASHIVIVPLNDLEEESWAILHVLGEDLQQVATFIIVHKDFQLLYV